MTIISIVASEFNMNTFETFKANFEALSSKEKVAYAKIRYKADSIVNVDYTLPLDYPLCIFTTDGFVFCIADVSISPPSSASLTMLKILEYLDFNVKENQIITSRNLDVNLDFFKDDVFLSDCIKEFWDLEF